MDQWMLILKTKLLAIESHSKIDIAALDMLIKADFLCTCSFTSGCWALIQLYDFGSSYH